MIWPSNKHNPTRVKLSILSNKLKINPFDYELPLKFLSQKSCFFSEIHTKKVI